MSAAIKSSLSTFGYSAVKTAQAEAVEVVLLGKDVFVSVPTAYGKSLVYQMPLVCASYILEGLGKFAPRSPVYWS